MSFDTATVPLGEGWLPQQSHEEAGMRRRTTTAPTPYSLIDGNFNMIPQNPEPAPFGGNANAANTYFGQQVNDFAEPAPKARVPLTQRMSRFIRNTLAPKKYDYNEAFVPAPPPTRCNRARNIVTAIFVSLVVVFTLFGFWLYVNGHGANRVLSAIGRPRAEIAPTYIMPNGFLVHNVLNPLRPVATLGDVTAMVKKLTRLPSQRVASIDAATAARGYLSYRYTPAFDAEELTVNTTIDALLALMKSYSPFADAGIVCEGLIHYGIELNALYVNRWDDDTDNSTGLLYNPSISERSGVQVVSSDEVIQQNHCRISEIIDREAAKVAQTVDTVPMSPQFMVSDIATLEYTVESGKKRRKKIRQPLLQCVDHVLKLSGIK